MRPNLPFAVIWIGWMVSWFAASFWTARTEKRDATWQTWAYRACVLAGAPLLWLSARHRLDETRLWHVGSGGGYALAALTLAGIAFAWWARIHLGRLWSRWVVRKADHRIIQTGPYAIVRHPIYTGISLTALATATITGTTSACLGAALMILSWYIKARLEERFLREQLSAEAYDAYARCVPMLVPFLRI
jgi:protein-S-isoprenylcysteine O-methyltransferase Ste14